jgi:hypothetical protein
MQIDKPTWHLKKRRCPCACGGEVFLVFSACPKCRSLMLECDEVGTIFPNPNDLSKEMDWIENAEGCPTFSCPYCNASGLVGLDNATDIEIVAAGFNRTDYE